MNYFDLKVGFTCNNNCVHCVVTDKKSTQDLSTQEIKSIIDTVPKGDTIGFTGGEATIRSDFIELLQYAKQTGHGTALQTNGAMFSNKEFTTTCSKHLDNVLIAIHSHIESIHTAIVQTVGMYEKTIAGFKNIVDAGINCRTQTVISKLNIASLCETYEFIQLISPNIRMNLTYPHPNGNALKNANIVVPRYSDIRVYLQKILKKFGSLLSTEAIPMCYLYPYQDAVEYNQDEHLIDTIKSGMDPANKNNSFFDKDGITNDYGASMLSDKRKVGSCVKCIFNNRCIGVWKEYIDIHTTRTDLCPIGENLIGENMNESCKEEQNIIRNKAGGVVRNDNGAIIINGKEKCMNACFFCSGRSNSNTDENRFQETINNANYFIKNGFKNIEISGGDPGEFEYISEVVMYLKDNGIENIQLSTHGRTLKDENLVKRLAVAGLTSCRIPLYGSNSEIHNKCTQVNSGSTGNAFEDSIEGIRNCVKNGIRICGHTAINQYNKKDINNIIRLYLNITNGFMENMIVGTIFITYLDYEYTSDWYLPTRVMRPYIDDILKNRPQLPGNVYFKVLDVPYCTIGRFDEQIENPFQSFPNIGNDLIAESLRSKTSNKIPSYRIKTYFTECECCSLKNRCGAITENEIKMFGTYGLKAIK